MILQPKVSKTDEVIGPAETCVSPATQHRRCLERACSMIMAGKIVLTLRLQAVLGQSKLLADGQVEHDRATSCGVGLHT